MTNIIELYDSWTFTMHDNFTINRINILPYSDLINIIKENNTNICFIDVIKYCKENFLTLNCQLKFRSLNAKKQRYVSRQIDYPILLGSTLAKIIDLLLHSNSKENVISYDYYKIILANFNNNNNNTNATTTTNKNNNNNNNDNSKNNNNNNACLNILNYLNGVFIINGVVKYLPTHLYLRNRQIHVNNKNDVVFYHYYTTTKKLKSEKNDYVNVIKSDKFVYRKSTQTFYKNDVLIDEDTLQCDLDRYQSLTVGDYSSDYSEGIIHWIKNCHSFSFDDLRMKYFFSPGHILWLLRDYSLRSDKNNPNNTFKKGINVGNIKFLFSATAKFLPVLAREATNEFLANNLAGDSIHNVFREVNINNPLYSQTIHQSVTKLTSGYACNSINRRLIHDSEFNYLCAYSNTHGHKIGLNIELVKNCQISGSTENVDWDKIIETTLTVGDQVALPFPLTSADELFVYIFINSVPVFKRKTDNLQRDITLLYLALKDKIRRIVPFVEFRHDYYTALFINIVPGLIVKNHAMSPAERSDFYPNANSHKSCVNVCSSEIFCDNIKHLPYYRYNPPARNIFVLHSIRCLIQLKRPDLHLLNFSDYPYLIDSDTTKTGINGFLLSTIYLPYRELTAEDGLILSKSASEKIRYRYMEQIRVFIHDIHIYPIIHVKPGDFIAVDHLLATFPDCVKVKVTRKCYFVNRMKNIIFYSNRFGRILEINEKLKNSSYMLTMIIENERNVVVGDKLCTLNGQKSIIAGIVEDEKMPKRFYDKKVPDVIACCESFTTRFTIGQLHESIDNSGFDVYLENYEHPVFWGKVFYCLLHHFVQEKFSSFRDKISLSLLTKQPGKARVRNSGVRLSLSELSALESFGLSQFVHNKFIRESDGVSMFFCEKHGCMHESKHISELKGFHCLNRGYFQLASFTTKRCIEDYAIVGIDIRQNKKTKQLF